MLCYTIADGLRADKFYEMVEGGGNNTVGEQSRSPYLRGIVENKGSWGVSHTRVPTETRPGHVALIAGFYEDVSAVTKGWKSNPVEFDHFFNQTTYSWGYGSPDVLPMFAENVPQLTTESYPEEAEDFGGDASKLDLWVFDKVEQLLKNASTDEVLYKKLHSEKVSIFLHLLGLDTNGHAYRPNSVEYYENIRVVDRGIENICKQIEEFYGNDGKTSFVFTADHGMSNRGSHGDGERSNTETPLVAWGAGVRGPLSVQYQMERIKKLRGKGNEHILVNPETPENWKLSHLMRSDVSQADIAPLMSTLIGVPPPLNSVGVLPTEYLGTSDQYTTDALLANTLQIWEMYSQKSSSKEKSSLLFYSPFTKLQNGPEKLVKIDKLISEGQYEEAQFLCLDFIQLCLEGLNYYQTYDRPMLMTVITLGYTGWIVTVLLYVLNNYSVIGMTTDRASLNKYIPKFEKYSRVLMIGGSVLFFGYLFSNDSPLLYYLYCYFVIFFWGKCIPANIVPLYIFLKDTHSKTSMDKNKIINQFILLIVVAIAVMELLVVAYFYRAVLSLLYLIFGILSTLFMYKANTMIKVIWLLSCIAMSVFPYLPIDFGSSVKLVCLGSFLVIALGIFKQNYNISRNPENIFKKSQWSKWKPMEVILLVSILFSTWLVYNTDKSLELKVGLPYFNQVSSWLLLVSSILILGFYKGKSYYDHWSFISLSLSIPFILLCVSYESLFLACLIFNLTLWKILELSVYNKVPNLKSHSKEQPSQSSSKSSMTDISQHDIRRAIIYIFFCYVGFFGTGNIASISSFEISSTYRFTTIFDPFLMAALLLVKVFIPLLLVTVSFSFLNNSLGIARPSSFLVVIALSDIMSINFFFLVKDTGSWLEIGTSISHFAISSAFIILQLLLFAVSSLLVPTTNTNAHTIKNK
ncbi:phosphatidylinositol glycan [Tieghemostelium lacteum]|uniref:GPI ethanolamine phosphate transferase 1 n=1 Tax=Tieghemostelium lacteum TaxID=361077 RepID=A0A151ZD08_TIELA|nr:phosphatidylinositol glycan [Tieghemostelium lacteum]|eukprot:KYQ91842.1 phosphatidylinositol glycan [Tieghemostelium lacteum]